MGVGTRIVCERYTQHIALVRAPTNVQGSEGGKLVLVDQMDGARRTFSVWLAENIELPRDTLDEGLIDCFEDTIRV